MKKNLRKSVAAVVLGVAALALAGCGQQSTKDQAMEFHTEESAQLSAEEESELCYVAVDVNPSIELQVAEDGKILEAVAANEDAQKVLENLDIKGKDLEDAVETIMKSLKENGYLGMETPTDLLVSVEDHVRSEEVLAAINKGISNMLQTEKVKLNLMEQKITVTEEDIQKAKEYEISLGKYQFISCILKDDDEGTMEELAAVSINDLAAYALQNNLDLNQLLDAYQEAVEEALETEDADDTEDTEDADDADDVNDAEEVDDMEETDDVNDAEDADDTEDVDVEGDIEDTDDADDIEEEKAVNPTQNTVAAENDNTQPAADKEASDEEKETEEEMDDDTDNDLDEADEVEED